MERTLRQKINKETAHSNNTIDTMDLTDIYKGFHQIATEYIGASLVAQWLRVCLPMQVTRVSAPVREDPTCRGAARPMSHGHWACASGACALQWERPQQ